MSSRRRGESGQITVLVVVFTLCLLIAVIAVTDISGSYLRRQAASSLADGAALAATSAGADVGGLYDGEEEPEFVALDPAAAAAAVESYLSDTGAYSHYPGLAANVVVDGPTVRVYLTMPYVLPVTMPGVAGTTTIHSAGSAQLPIY